MNIFQILLKLELTIKLYLINIPLICYASCKLDIKNKNNSKIDLIIIYT